MRSLLFVLFIFSLSTSLHAETLVDSSITASVTWNLEGSPYIVDGTIQVSGTSQPVVTVEPGVQVRFNSAASLVLGSASNSAQKGGLIVNGTADSPVLFTANTDTPSAGYWNCIKLNTHAKPDSVILNHAILEYGGSGGNGLFDVKAVDPTLSNCCFRYSANYGIYHNASNVNASITDCEFNNNAGYPIYTNVSGAHLITGNNMFSNNGNQRILLRSVNLSIGCTWQNHGIPYELEGDLVVYNGANPLLLSPGTIMLFREGKAVLIGSNTNSTFKGSLVAEEATFTALDNQLLWRGIDFQNYSQTSTLESCEISFVGSSAPGAVTLRGSNLISINNCEFHDIDNYAICGFSGKLFLLTNCNIHNCSKTVSAYFQDIHKLGQGNIYQTNGDNRIHCLAGTLSESAIWTRQYTSILMLGSSGISGVAPYPELQIPYGTVLEFAAGTNLSIGSASSSSYKGSLKATGVTFKGQEAMSGYWTGLIFNYHGLPSLVSACIIRDAGYANAAALQLSIINSTITGCTIYNNAAKGINFANNSLVLISGNVIFGCGSYPLSVDANAVRVLGEGNNFTGNAIDQVEVRHETIQNSGVWRNPGVPYYLTGSMPIYGTQFPHLKILPGAVILLPNGALLSVGYASTASYKGSLEAEGVLFTRAEESAEPCGLIFNRHCNIGRSVLTNCIFENFCNSTYNSAVYVSHGADPVFDSCIFRNNPGIALAGASDARAVVNNCSFISNGSYPISITAASFDVVSGVGNTFSGNNPDRILLAGGTLNTDYTWDNPSVPVEISSSINIYGTEDPILTINSGLVLLFREDTGLTIGYGSSISYSGALKAEGARFSALNGIAGGWNGIQYLRYIEPDCYLKNCIVEYGGAQGHGNVFLNNSPFSLIEGCIIRFASIGIKASGSLSAPLIKASHIVSNETGIYCQNLANPTIGGSMDDSNAIVGNNLYGVQTITTNTIDASYNWWGDINGPTTRNGDAISGNISYLPYRNINIGDAPANFDLSSPPDLTVLSNLTPILDWEEALDPSPGDTVLYTLQICANPGFDNELIQYSALSSTVFHVESGVLLDDTHYYWRVIAEDTQEQYTPSNQVFEFFTAVPEHPSAFNLLWPEQDESVHITSPCLQWQHSIDPDPDDTVNYRVYLSLTAGFDSADSLDTAQDFLYTPFCTPGNLFYWKILAYDTSGLTSESAVRRFYVDMDAKPRAPALITLEAFPGYVQISWDPVPGAEAYHLYYSSDPNFDFNLLGETSQTQYQHNFEGTKCFYYIKTLDY
ncbi:MAG: right-handed parallel beta-helix repeat-containing protein [Candidatus Cloacimonadaceae bacterium]|jgi:hypothetical protein|nr:right-handed parallel beta-helix repeat-containing protein [Candidatus Cloacimonadaceae bacterium]